MRREARNDTRGFTLAELIAVLAILALLSGVVAVSVGSLKASATARATSKLDAARRAAILSGRPVPFAGDSACAHVLFLPDGSAIGTKCRMGIVAITIDPLSGATRVAR